jgi:hypothetical protein
MFNDMRKSKLKSDEQHQSAPTIHSPQPLPTLEQIRRRAHDIYVARGGGEGLALNDWLKAEQDLKEIVGWQKIREKQSEA